MTYTEFIDNILNTRDRFQKDIHKDQYFERHHILPRCLGGSNDSDNLIDLYADEHFIAHQLLAKENPENKLVVLAFHMMTFSRDDKYSTITPEMYKESRQMLHDALMGHEVTEETRRRISESRRKHIAQTGIKCWNIGLTKEQDERLRTIGEKSRVHMTGFKQSEECCKKHSASSLAMWKRKNLKGGQGSVKILTRK